MSTTMYCYRPKDVLRCAGSNCKYDHIWADDHDEKIEASQYDAARISRLGYMNHTHWEEFKAHATAGLVRFGDKFLQALGLALSVASLDDAIKIIRAWHEPCEKHAILYKIQLAKEATNEPTE